MYIHHVSLNLAHTSPKITKLRKKTQNRYQHTKIFTKLLPKNNDKIFCITLFGESVQKHGTQLKP